ncbi:hypothetical protein QTH89_25795 [Variovorax sp. J22G21]|uniref:hypothetical protein n=1 Tax=Variovorax fucosicus TaxID=3053517 RepID=UPI0025748FCD|nr:MULTISPECIES: hypothetical protein [unclassified Variovorax]MDM0039798.1 hypothetical protein [Variovorax sp. J22R193]MDM0064653.1 hypothetical protein [Variovorax sp. J22G21]
MNLRFIRPSRRALASIKTLTGIAMVCVLAACSTSHDANAPTAENLAAPLDDYLAQRGDICLAMFDWPIDLTEAEAGSGARHAIQFPVMEQLGLLHSTIVTAPKSSENPDGAVKRFELTEAGRKFYKPHPYAAHGTEHANDFCVAHLKREKIVEVKVDASDARHPLAVVSYTYQIDPAPWMQNDDAQRVFPMIARIMNGAGGQLQLRQGFTLGDKGWAAQMGPV